MTAANIPEPRCREEAHSASTTGPTSAASPSCVVPLAPSAIACWSLPCPRSGQDGVGDETMKGGNIEGKGSASRGDSNRK